MRRFILRVSATSRLTKRAIAVAYDLIAMIVALIAAFCTRLGSIEFRFPWQLGPLVLLSCAIGIATLYKSGVYHIVLRFLNTQLLGRLVPAAIISAGALVVMAYMARIDELPRSIGFIWPAFLVLFWFAGRYVLAELIAWADDRRAVHVGEGKPILIYGATAAGAGLAQALHLGRVHRACCFIDDDPALHGQRLAGLSIYGPDALSSLVETLEIKEACLALPSASRQMRLTAIDRLSALGLTIKTIPSPDELVSGRFTVSDVRPVDVNDLLSRDAVLPDRALIVEASAGHTILITGAGGSIGSEICRQLLLEAPAKLVLLDHSEFALYAISEELHLAARDLPEANRPQLVPVIGSILNESLLRATILDHSVDTIFHAAAYKHVPLLESNEVVGVQNNVIGTVNLARLSHTLGLAKFTMISTDKAVRPKSVMGASKRAAELIVQAYANQPGNATRFGIVRFGNVLDSSGSVVQRFREQIRTGGPLTVTHRDITRFFMSIPEATQLVLQASAMASDGEVYVLDMGEPVRIYDLAANMVRLSGMTVRDDANPDGDIAIEVVGLRPGEKLYEELFVGDSTEPTGHARIQKAHERFVSLDDLMPEIDRLRARIDRRDAMAVRTALDDLIALDGLPAGSVLTAA